MYVMRARQRLLRLINRRGGTAGTEMTEHDEAIRRLYRRLFAWYSCVLAGVFLLFFLALSFSMPELLTIYSRTDLLVRSSLLAQQWQTSGGRVCPQAPDGYLVTCFDQRGRLIALNGSTPAEPFRANDLALAVLRTHAAADDAFDINGAKVVYRYGLALSAPVTFRRAVLVTSPNSGASPEVLQLGMPLATSVHYKYALAWTLGVLTGLLVLLGAPLGGRLLANRAVLPARLAFKRQQDFIANVSHELRTPLALLRADAEVLLRGRERLAEDDAALLEDIVAETAHMNQLANNMLLLARLDSGRLPLERDVLDLAELAGAVARRVRAFAEEQGITLEVESAGRVLVLGDRTLLEQALLVLLDNAIKYNRRGGCVRLHAFQKNERAYLEVRDSGIGISAEHLPFLGERFYRVDKARSRESGGSGLGLSIARAILAAHNGALALSSTPGEGTTAALTLPAISRT